LDKEPAPPVRPLSRDARRALERHFLALDTDDRRLRFGIPLGDAAVHAYVENIDFDRDALFGVFDAELRLVGAAHLSCGDKQAELGLSVLTGYRNRGYGSALLARACLRARNWGVARIFMHYLRENAAIMHLARKQGMEIATNAVEAKAWLELPPADPSSLFHDSYEHGMAVDLPRKCFLVPGAG
jgi:GNAT superfamily N-acetyltransferase